MAEIHHYEMRRGETPVIESYLRDENDDPVNDPTAQYKLTARASPNAADPPVFEVTSTQFSAGVGRSAIPTSATNGFTYDRVLYFDVLCIESNGNRNVLQTGTITVRAAVAR